MDAKKLSPLSSRGQARGRPAGKGGGDNPRSGREKYIGRTPPALPFSYILGKGFMPARKSIAPWPASSAVAALSGISRQMLGYVENDQRRLSIVALGFLAAPLGLTASELLHEAEFSLARLPGRSKKCHNCCLRRGELPWLNVHGECLHPVR